MAAVATDTIRYHVTGMDCSSCAAKIEGAARKVEGVADVKVDTRAETVTVTFESSQTDAAGIARAVTEAGFPAKVRTGGE